MKDRKRLSRVSPLGIARKTGLYLAVSAGAALVPGPATAADAPSLGRPVPMAQTAAASAAPVVPAVPAGTLGLQECLHLALQRQPRIAAQRASLAAAEDAQRALENLCVPGFVARDLPVRRRQAALGVQAAAAAVDQAERETVYAVMRNYFTVVYARQQRRVAGGVVAQLSDVQKLAADLLKRGAANVNSNDVNRSAVVLELARTRRLQADEGIGRALAALREAIGLEPGCPIDVPAGPLPEPGVHLSQADAVAWALARRGDLIQANIFVDLTCLEVEAQGTSLRHRMETFAAGGDIHARPIPPEAHDGEYHPGAVPPEMPTMLAGSRAERMKHAESLHQRALAVAEKTRNLVALDAEDAFRRWQGAVARAAHAGKAADSGERLVGTLRKDFTGGVARMEDVVNAHVLGAQARSQHNEALYQEILALADLERATAGGFCAGPALQPAAAPARPAAPAEAAPPPRKRNEPDLFPKEGR